MSYTPYQTNQSVSGTVGSSVIGVTPVVIVGAPSVYGNISGSVVAWLTSTNASVLTVSTPIANQSVSGAVSVSNFPTTQNVSGSVVATQGTSPWIMTGSVQGTLGSSIIGLTPVAVTNTPSISGTILVGNFPGNQSVSGAVSVSNFPTSQNVSGSVVAFQAGTQITSISGVNGIVSVMALGQRNDTLASVTGTNLTYLPPTVGAAGETVISPAPFINYVYGIASTFTGVIQPVIAAQGASVFTYVTGIQTANASANNTFIQIFGATSSTIGYVPAPANSGAVAFFRVPLKSNANGAISASVRGVASVFVTIQGFTARS